MFTCLHISHWYIMIYQCDISWYSGTLGHDLWDTGWRITVLFFKLSYTVRDPNLSADCVRSVPYRSLSFFREGRLDRPHIIPIFFDFFLKARTPPRFKCYCFTVLTLNFRLLTDFRVFNFKNIILMGFIRLTAMRYYSRL